MDTEQFIAIENSLGIVTLQCMNSGLGELWEEYDEIRVFPMLRLLSSGLERFCKVVIQLRKYDRDGEFYQATHDEVMGHNVRDLLIQCCGLTLDPTKLGPFHRGPSLEDDINWLRGKLDNPDSLMFRFMTLLSDFATGDRYDYLNTVGRNKEDSAYNFTNRWDEEILVDMAPNGDSHEEWKKLRYQLVSGIERISETLAEMIFHTDIDDQLQRAAMPLKQAFLAAARPPLRDRSYPDSDIPVY